MSDPQTNNPLHGQTLEMIVNYLVEHLGWDASAPGQTIQTV